MTFPDPAVAPPSISGETALEARRLTVSYGADCRLRDVNASFLRNRITAIIGASGCGKSTLLRTLNRTIELIPGARIDTGMVLLEGEDVYTEGFSAPWVRSRVGILQQKPTPFPMSILENVLFGARYHGRVNGSAQEDARRYLEKVGLWDEVKDRLRSSALTLSGGQQQRLCLARTLAVEPSILLMDEPCSALDPRATAAIESLLRDLARDYTIVIVTHNVAQARRVADCCVFMQDGAVLAAGSREEMLIHPQHAAVREFVTGAVG